MGAYLQARPDTNVYLTSGIWHPEIAKMLREEGRQKGEILIAGFGAFQWAIDEVKDGLDRGHPGPGRVSPGLPADGAALSPLEGSAAV